MAVNDPFVTCDNKELIPLDVLLAAVIHKDANGKAFVNVISSNISCSDITPALDCTNKEIETKENLWRQCFVFDACGNLALRLGVGTP